MERLARHDLRTLNAFLHQIYAHGDLKMFPMQTLAALSQIVPADICGYNEVNLRRKRLVALLDPADAHFPNNQQLWATHMHEHPVLAEYRRTYDGRAYKISDFLTRPQFHRLALYNEVYRHQRAEDQMSVTLPAPAPLVIALTFSRSRRTFSERDRLVLNVLRPHLIQAYHNAEALTQLRQEMEQLKQVLEECNRGIIILTSRGGVQLMTGNARQWLQDYYGQATHQRAGRLPEDMWLWICQQQSVLTPHDAVPPSRTPLVVEREGKRLVVRLLTNQAEGQMLLLLEEQCTTVSLTPLVPLGLTKRENEILYWVAQGKTNKEVALRLGLSPHTVRTRLENIYGKLGVETRTAAAARALDMLGLMRQ